MKIPRFLKTNHIIWLLLVIFIASWLRFYQLNTIAPSLTWDEVAWGYNAYTLGIDGRDEFGRLLPYDYLESFGDFKPPVYAYLDIFPVKLFGLNEFAVRFPSAFFGTLTVFVTYFLTKAIFSPSRKQGTEASLEIGNWKLDIPIVAAALLTISPWHIMLSRAAFEANVATFFLVSGVWLFLEAVQRRPWLLILSAIAFTLSIYTFNTTRIVAPLLLLGLAIMYRKELWQIKQQVVLAALAGLLLVLPTVPFLLSPQASLRFKEVNIFSDISVIERTNQEMANDNHAAFSNILHNRRVAFSIEYIKHYFDNLSPAFLFISGDGNPKFSTQTMGQLYLFELPFLIVGMLFLFRKRENNWFIIPLWLLIAIIPAATARETPHALRIETTLPMFQILIAYGLVQSFYKIKPTVFRFPIKKFLLGVLIIFAGCNVFYFLEEYFVHYAKEYSREWQHGYKEAIAYIKDNEKDYDTVYLTDALGRPYIYTLFYLSYDPVLFREQANVHRDAFGFVTVKSFDKYYFDKELLSEKQDEKILYVDIPRNVPQGAMIQKTFYLMDGKASLVAYTL